MSLVFTPPVSSVTATVRSSFSQHHSRAEPSRAWTRSFPQLSNWGDARPQSLPRSKFVFSDSDPRMNTFAARPPSPPPVDPAIRKTYDNVSRELAEVLALPGETSLPFFGKVKTDRDARATDLQGRLFAMEKQFAGLKPPSAADSQFFSASNPPTNSFSTRPSPPTLVDPSIRKTYNDLSTKLAGVMALPGEFNMPLFGNMKTDRDAQVKDIQGQLLAMENQFEGLKPAPAPRSQFFCESDPRMNSFATRPPSPQPVDPAIRKTHGDLSRELAAVMALPGEWKSAFGSFKTDRDSRVADLQGRLAAIENQFPGVRSA